MTISLEISMKKLVRLTAHTLRGSARQPLFRSLGAGSDMSVPPQRLQMVLGSFYHGAGW